MFNEKWNKILWLEAWQVSVVATTHIHWYFSHPVNVQVCQDNILKLFVMLKSYAQFILLVNMIHIVLHLHNL